LADLIVLSKDIFSINPVEIENVKIDAIYLEGELIYARSGRRQLISFASETLI